MNSLSPNWGALVGLSALLGAFLFAQSDDWEKDILPADLALIQQEQQAKSSREFAAKQVCGPGAYGEWIDDKTLQCTPKRGRAYQVAEAK